MKQSIKPHYSNNLKWRGEYNYSGLAILIVSTYVKTWKNKIVIRNVISTHIISTFHFQTTFFWFYFSSCKAECLFGCWVETKWIFESAKMPSLVHVSTSLVHVWPRNSDAFCTRNNWVFWSGKKKIIISHCRCLNSYCYSLAGVRNEGPGSVQKHYALMPI